MFKKVINIIKENALIIPGDTVVAAFSGGGDSSALLDILYKAKDLLEIKIIGAHVNHNIRGEEASRDENFCGKFCAERGIEFKAFHVDAPRYSSENNISLENAARILRIKALKSLLPELQNAKIATAHNLNDQAETVLMRLMRGSSGFGLRGMDIKSQSIIRPLLYVTRDEIDIYLSENNIPYVTDSTNASMDFTRNRIRNTLIPLIKKEFNPNIINTLAKTAISFNEDSSVLNRLADEAYRDYAVLKKGYVLIRKEAFNALDSAVLKRLIRKCAMDLSGNITDFDSVHTEMVLDMFSKETGKAYSLAKGLKCANIFGDIAVYKENYKKLTPKELKQGDFVYIDEDYGYISLSLGKPAALENCINTCIGVFNCDRINERLILRNRERGDIFIKPNGDKVKLKDYMINRKIPWFIRDNTPVLACGNEIIWVLNEDINKEKMNANESEDTLNILFIQLWRTYGGQ